MISFKDGETRAIFDGKSTKAARKRCPQAIWGIARRKMDALNAATRLEDLKSPGNQLEKLKGDRAGQYSVRINAKYRICFSWTNAGAVDVELADYHD